jgi:hypothetical protein
MTSTARAPQSGNTDGRKHQREVEPQQQLQDQRRAAEQPGVAGRNRLQHRIGRQPHDRHDNAEEDAERHRQHRHHHGVDDALKDRFRGQEAADIGPFDLAAGESAADHGEHEDDERCRKPAAPMRLARDPRPG